MEGLIKNRKKDPSVDERNWETHATSVIQELKSKSKKDKQSSKASQNNNGSPKPSKPKARDNLKTEQSSDFSSSDSSYPVSEEDRSKQGEEVHSSWSSHQKLEDPEQIDYESNTYLTIFDNIFKRTIQDLTLKENIKKDLLKVMSKDH